MKQINPRGKTALVTGASRGVGKQVALKLAQLGCNLVLHSRDNKHTQEVADLAAKFGVKVICLQADLGNVSEAIAMAEQADRQFNGIDLLFNNAAIMTPWKTDYISDAEDYLKSFTVNIISLIKICDVILPAMLKRGFGRIVNVTSGIKDQPELTPYSVSKAAVDKYVKDFACKLEGTDVLMNLLDPGWLRTDLGGENAPNSVESVIPGALVPLLLEKLDGSGKLYCAQDYAL